MTVSEFAKYVVDNMYKATLSNSLNITKNFVNFPYPLNTIYGNNTKVYDFEEFLNNIDSILSDYIANNRINHLQGCRLAYVVAKYRNEYNRSYKGEPVYKLNNDLFADEQYTNQIIPVENKRYYDQTEGNKKSYVYENGKFSVIDVFNYQLFMLVDNFVIDFWGCYQNGH